MSLKGVLSIGGMPGLYKVVAKTKNGFIVESFSEKKRFPVTTAQKITMLEDITMYCTSGDVPLKEVMLKMKAHDETASQVNPKADNNDLKKFFETILPDYDKERVYASDIQKVIKWYQALKDHVTFEDDAQEEKEEDGEDAEVTEAEGEKKMKSKKAHKDDVHSKADIGLSRPIPEKKVVSAKTRKKV